MGFLLVLLAVPARANDPIKLSELRLEAASEAKRVAPHELRRSTEPGTAADRRSYTSADVAWSLVLDWAQGSERAGRIPLWVKTHFASVTLRTEVAVSTGLKPCPERVLLRHEREHQAAFARIFDEWESDLNESVAWSQISDGYPTEQDPLRLRRGQLPRARREGRAEYEEAVARSVEALRWRLDSDRAWRDEPERYRLLFRGCPLEDWR